MHSAPLAEIAAHVCGFVAGISAYAICGAITSDHVMRVKIGVFFSVVANAIVGGRINLVMKDFISLVVIRPVSAYLGAKLLAYVANAMGTS